jgi:DNA-binding transcriptional LysR family regulator
MQDVEVRLVKSFVAVADERSFTRAAQRLNVAQPWLSVQIRKLEDQIGFRLFERNRNQGVVLSPQAEALLPAARDYLVAVERMTDSARRIRDRETSVLRVGAPDFSAEMPMRSAILDGFVSAHPRIELEVTNALSVELLKQLRAGELDIAFTIGPHVEPATEAVIVARYPMAVLGWADDLRELRQPLPLKQLAGREVAIFRRVVNPPLHDSLAPVMEAAGISVVHLAETGVRAIIHNSHRTGMLALIGQYTPANSLPEPLVMVELDAPDLSFNLNIVRRAGDRSPPGASFWTYALRLRGLS